MDTGLIGTARALDEATLKVLELSDRDKFAVFEILRHYLSEVFDDEAEATKEISSRAECLEVVCQVGDHLGLEGKTMTTAQFNEATDELGLDWNSAKVIRAFGRWRNAMSAYRGERTPEGPARRSIRRAASSAHNRGHEEAITGLRLWLESGPASKQMTDYDDFRLTYNEGLEDGQKPLRRAYSVVSSLPLAWKEIVKLATGDEEPAVLRQRELAKQTGVDGAPLIGTRAVALILGRNQNSIKQYEAKEEFPKPVAQLNKASAWRRSDVEAYRDDLPFPKRKRFGEQASFLDRLAVAARIGLAPDQVGRRIWAEDWSAIPEPEGRIGRSYYWRATAVEDWVLDQSSAD